MTISDLILRLKALQKSIDIGSTAQVQIGREYNRYENPFEYFDKKVVGKNIVLVPSDKWDKQRSSKDAAKLW